MPTYNYQCKKCNHKFQAMQSITKRKESVCPECGNIDNDLFIGTGSGFVLKGEGFYENTKKDAEMYQPMDKEDD